MKALLRTINTKPAIRNHIHPSNHLRILRTYASMEHSVPSLSDPSLLKSQTYVNGKWIDAKSGKTFEVHDPASGKIIGTMPEMNKEDTEEAIKAAAAAFPSFSKTTGRERSKMLRKWYQLMVDNADDLAKLITWVRHEWRQDGCDVADCYAGEWKANGRRKW